MILANLSADAAGYVTEIRRNYKLLTELDFIFAKGSFALSLNASKPILTTMAISISVKDAIRFSIRKR